VSEPVVLADLRAEVDVPVGGILSRTVHRDEHSSLTVFAFDAGQELTEHTAARPAIIEILEGTAEVSVGGDVHRLGVGGWVALPPRTPHGILATTPLKVALLLIGPA